MCVGVRVNVFYAGPASGKPTRSLYPHTLLPGGLGGGAPSTRQAWGNPTQASKMSKCLKGLEMV